jgi:hypothetical protein
VLNLRVLIPESEFILKQHKTASICEANHDINIC